MSLRIVTRLFVTVLTFLVIDLELRLGISELEQFFVVLFNEVVLLGCSLQFDLEVITKSDWKQEEDNDCDDSCFKYILLILLLFLFALEFHIAISSVDS